MCSLYSSPWSAQWRKSGYGESAGSLIWRRGVLTNEKKDGPLGKEGVITHASRPDGPANVLFDGRVQKMAQQSILINMNT